MKVEIEKALFDLKSFQIVCPILMELVVEAY